MAQKSDEVRKELRREMSVLKVERTKPKLHSASHSKAAIDKLLTNYFSNNQVLTRPDFQRLYGFTKTTAARHIQRLKEEKKLDNINSYYHPIYVPMPGFYGKPKA